MSWSAIATWSFSFKGIETAGGILHKCGSAMDAAELIARMVEDDAGVDTVGFGAIPNIKGEVELDAAFMDGRDLSIGAVAGVKGFKNPVSIARKVMTDTPHNFLIGCGAEDFAALKGCRSGIMNTDRARKIWEQKKSELENGKTPDLGHDTVGIVVMDTSGNMTAATSTSGLAMKYRGRVGDSPLVGSGFYVDNEAGGAAATGVGEDIMRGCTCFYAVELLRQGYTPKQAAEEAVRRIHKRLAGSRKSVGNIAIVCADNKGNFAGAANHKGFSFAAASSDIPSAIYQVQPLSDL